MTFSKIDGQNARVRVKFPDHADHPDGELMAKAESTAGPPRATFRAKVLLAGKTATGVVVPADVVAKLGKGRKPPVKVTINGHTYLSTVAVMGGKFMVGIAAEHRKSAGVEAGDTIDMTLELDTSVREVAVPDDFPSALNKDKKAKAFFDSMSYSNRRRHILLIDGAKTAETRQRRIEKALEMMREGRAV
jgi:hypothetical protein